MRTPRAIGIMHKFLLGFLCVLALGTSAKADVMIQFATPNTPPPGIGTLSWAGGTSDLVATNVFIDTLVATDGVTTYTENAELNFTTGAFVQVESNGDLYFGPNTSSSAITIVDNNTSEVLFTGSLMGAYFNPVVDQISLAFAVGSNTISQDLLTLLGLPSNTTFLAAGYLGTQQVTNPDNGFTTTVYEVDVKDHVVPDSGPSWVLLLMALACSAPAVRSRKLIRQS